MSLSIDYGDAQLPNSEVLIRPLSGLLYAKSLSFDSQNVENGVFEGLLPSVVYNNDTMFILYELDEYKPSKMTQTLNSKNCYGNGSWCTKFFDVHSLSQGYGG